MVITKRLGWPYLYVKAKEGKDSRKLALIRGYSWIEHALKASGYANKMGTTAQRILIARSEGLLDKSLTEDIIRLAIKSRHLAAHDDTIESEGRCYYIISVYERIWQSLRTNFVNIANAKKIAKKTFCVEGILSVSIYGSLSRKATNPNDIDLLVFDDGRYSAKIKDTLTEYNNQLDRSLSYNDPINRSLFCNEILHLNYNEEIFKCRWLDISIFDGQRFGNDNKYTQEIISSQADPYFFLNISKDLSGYNLSTDEFRPSEINFFHKLKKIKVDYDNLLYFK